MKKLIVLSFIAMGAIYFSTISCKKNESNDSNDDDTVTQTQHASDESFTQNESENALNEVNTAMSGTFGKTGGIAGATINDSTYIGIKKIIITYNGTSADGRRSRVGEVIVQLLSGANFGEAGAVVKVDFNNLKITQIASGKSVTLNGYHLIKNISGGHAFVSPSVTHTVRGMMTVTFDGTTASRNWQIARKRIVTVDGSIYTVTIIGDTNLLGMNNIVIWGTNRNDNAFYTQISSPLVFKSLCAGKPVSGVKVHKGLAKEITVTFGVDETGTPVTSGTTCPYGFKINWTNIKNVSKTAVISY